jgi:hypothetical protein
MAYYGCTCGQCRVRSTVGPFVLITIGVLFALDYIWGKWSFGETWPVILIVIGTVKIFERLASSEGHGGYFNPPTPPPPQSNPGGSSNAA